MISSNTYLAKCSELKELGYSPKFHPGMIVSRGFADLGYELFYTIPGDRCVSLFTGDVASLSHEEQAHFFVVPTSDDLTQELLRSGCNLLGLEYEEQREWVLKVQHASFASPQVFRAEQVEEVFLECLCHVLTLSLGNSDESAVG